ncbi:MAG: glucose 1-dehydrogenase [Gammaproteobacteria bacterium]|jgi:NAD(P)-dependent dehydrogenase (short-subunit alcohol dehydrogenase family)|nr:glucose 1-dehydrogenase [Gammaproteobacteria bacterium]
MKDKTLFVTGGNDGIGLATAELFAAQGANIAIFSRREDKNKIAVDKITAAGGTAISFAGDVTDEHAVKRAVNETAEHFGGLHYGFNNAGVDQNYTPLVDQTVEDFHRIIDINVLGVWLCMREQAPIIEASGGGCIVNNSSGAGHVGVRKVALYAASKHAVNGMTKSVALDYAQRGVRVNVVSPGGVKTAMMDDMKQGDKASLERTLSRHPMGRLGEADEVARAVLYLCRDATFTTGHCLLVDGGYTV